MFTKLRMGRSLCLLKDRENYRRKKRYHPNALSLKLCDQKLDEVSPWHKYRELYKRVLLSSFIRQLNESLTKQTKIKKEKEEQEEEKQSFPYL